MKNKNLGTHETQEEKAQKELAKLFSHSDLRVTENYVNIQNDKSKVMSTNLKSQLIPK